MNEQLKTTNSLKQQIAEQLKLESGMDIVLNQQPVSGISTLIHHVQVMRDTMQGQWIESLAQDLEHFYRGAFHELEKLSSTKPEELVDSVAQMMKYLSMGKAKGYSPEMLKRSLESARQLEEQVERAGQNFAIQSTAKHHATGSESEQDTVHQLQQIAVQRGMNQEDVGLAYRIGSRQYNNPSEAVNFAAEVAKVHANGHRDVEGVATSLGSLASMWSSENTELSQMTNMLVHASSLLNISLQDLMSSLEQTERGSTSSEADTGIEDRLANWISQAALSVQTSSGVEHNLTGTSNRVRTELLAEQLKTSVDNKSRPSHMEPKDEIQLQQKKMETIFQISTHRVMQGLRAEFSAFGNHLHAVLRLIGNQTSDMVNHLELLNRIMDDVGVQVAWEKVGQVMDQAKQKRYGKKESESLIYDNNAQSPKITPVRGFDIQRAGVVQEMKQQQYRLQQFNQQRTELADKTADKRSELTKTEKSRDVHKEKYDLAVAQNNGMAASLHASERDEAEKNVRRVARELFLLREEMDTLDAQIAKTKRNLEFLSREVDHTGTSILQLEHQSRLWLMTMNKMDLETVELRNKLYHLNNEFQFGATDVQRYESDLNKLRKQSDLLKATLTKLRNEVNELNVSFRKGLVDASAYIIKLKELEKLQLGMMMNGGMTVAPGTGASSGKEEKKDSGIKPFVARHEDLIKDVMKDAIMDGVDYGKKDNKVKKRGLFSRVKDMRETGNRKAFFNKHAPMRNKDGDILKDRHGKVITEHEINAERAARGIKAPGKLSKLVKFGSRMLRPLKAVPALGQAMVAMDVISGLVDPLSNIGKSEAEKQNIRATNKEELAKEFKDMKESSFVGKVWKGFNLGMDAVVSGTMSSLFGNSATNNKFGDYLDGFTALWTEKDGSAVEKKLAKEYNYEKEKKESQLQMDKEAGKTPEKGNQPQVQYTQPQMQYIPAPMQYIPGAGIVGSAANAALAQPKHDGIDELIAKVNRQLSTSTSNNETNYQVTRSRLLISGVREDSGQMRALMEKYLQENIKFFDKAIASLQKTYDKLAEGKEKDELGMEINEKKQQKAQSELELNSVKNSKIDELKRKMSDQLELTQMDYDKRMYDLLAANGGKEDSSEVIALNKARARDMNLKMDLYKQQWNELLKNGGFNVNSDEYMTILKELSSIGVEQSKNLAEISKKMDKPISTFNLPTGLKVLDYFDYMTAGNTHKSVMVGSGDVTVHVNIDNMTGSTKDVEKLTSALDRTLRKNTPGISNRMAGNVGAGMGSMYGPR
ncbi:hypothetical protein HUB98_05350 [Paenibacillus barcinonensis]|uniref:Uncharacterized protein n=1 Tax=Paenibacillus barcinonensis TaxID=198119 RepID=A0A2V4W7Y6_PAEBA|nr:hypothetical protein [Paenibacillus barcinonensis]PYE51413.1 hypothetical protein DFQ00_102207 [Paenibacillus barcinonensis]QKS55809.1 hypothetical protein HUB98_05350 [Paenibacillus barcinonensis]